MQVADYLISSGRCAQLDIEVGMCEQDTGADTGFCVRGGHIGMGMGACPSKLARVSGNSQ